MTMAQGVPQSCGFSWWSGPPPALPDGLEEMICMKAPGSSLILTVCPAGGAARWLRAIGSFADLGKQRLGSHNTFKHPLLLQQGGSGGYFKLLCTEEPSPSPAEPKCISVHRQLRSTPLPVRVRPRAQIARARRGLLPSSRF